MSLCVQEKRFVGESQNSYKRSLLDLPLNYWDILFISHPLTPKATLLKCVSCLTPSSLPSYGTLSF